MKYLIILLMSCFFMGCDYGQKAFDKVFPPQPKQHLIQSEDFVDKEPTVEELRAESKDLKQKLKERQKKVVKKDGVQTVMEISDPLKVKKDSVRYIYLGSFKTEYFYEEMLKKAKQYGLDVVVGQVQKGEETLRTIKVGPMSRSAAKEKIKELKEEGFPSDIFLTK